MSVTASNGTPSLTYQWEESDDNGGTDAWDNAVGGSGSTTNAYTTPALSSTIYYRVVVSASGNGCTTATSAAVAVTVVPDPTITTPPSGATICSGGTHSMSVTASNGTPSLTYQWEESDDNGGTDAWSNAVGGIGATTSAYTTPALASTIYYRVVVSASGNGCTTATSAAVAVTVVPDPTITTPPSGATICSGGTHSMSVTASNGTPSLTYQWEESDDNGGTDAWDNAVGGSGSTTNAYTTPALSSTIYYRVVVSASGNGCTTATSAAVAVTVVPDPTITTPPSGATICSGGTHSMSVTASNGTPSLTYQWEESDDNGGTDAWSNAVGGIGATTSAYTTPALASTIYYRVVVSASGNGCTTATSAGVAVTVVPDPIITTPPTGTTICSGGTHSMSVTASNGTPSLTYQWEESDDNGGTDAWSNAVGGIGATTSAYTTPALASTIYYRVVVSASGNGCTTATSAGVAVTVVPDPIITTPPTGTTICSGGTHSMSVTASNGTPSLTYQWEESDDNGGTDAWSNAVGGIGATTSAYTTPALASTIYYRVVVSASGNGCTTATSAAVAVTVVPDPIITTPPTGTTICSGGTHSMSVTASNGTPSLTYQWEESDDNGGTDAWSNAVGGIGATTSAYTTPALASTIYYRVVVSASGNGCTTATSAGVAVTVVPDPIITTPPTGTTICSGGTHSMSVTASNGTPSLTYQWEESDDNGGTDAWSNAVGGIGATTSAYTTPALASTIYYRVVVSASGNGCTTATSAGVAVTVVPDPIITTPPTGTTICSGGTHSMSVTASNGTPSLTYQWEESDDNGGTDAWSNAVGGIGATTSAYTTPALASTIYYRVVVSASGNGCTTATSAAVAVTVVPDPIITTPPTGTTICSGGTHSMSVTASNGTPSLTYQWEESDDNGGTDAWSNAVGGIGATTSAYTTPALASTIYYRVVVSASGNGCTTATSAAVAVTVVPDPIITTPPTGTTICSGGTHSMSVTASNGTPSLTYQWEESDDNGGTDAWSNAVGGIGATTSAYTTPALASTIYYRVVVSASGNGCTTATSAGVAVTVNPLPLITIDLVSPVCNTSNSFSLPYSGTTYSPITYSISAGIPAMPGFTPVVNTALPVSPIIVSIPIDVVEDNYQFIITVRNANGCISVSQTFNVIVFENQVASAGGDQNLCNSLSSVFAGNSPSKGTGTWTYISGPDNTPTFGDLNSANSSVDIDLYGTYVFRWTIVNGSCQTQDEVTIDFNEDPTGLNAGLDAIAVCDAMSYTLTGTGHTYQVGSEHNLSTRTWSYVSGPDATPTFADATDPHSLVTVDLYGSYVFRWTEINGNCTLFDEVTIDFNETPDGLSAGLDAIAVCDAMSYTLAGTGHTYQAGSEHNLSTRTWSYVSGPDATPTFADATDPHSLVTVDLYGSYVFRWTEINGNCTLFDEVTIDFNETPDGLNAGLDAIAVCDAMSYTLTGTGHTYQGSSEHNLSTRSWSYVSGPDATPTFADATDPHSLVTVDLYGSYVFRWTEINGNCTLFDEVTIDFNETPDGLNAGLDAIAVCDAMSYTLAGTGHTYQVGSEHNLSTRTWSYVSGPDATPTFADATDPHSLVTVDLYGSYVFRWTEINGNCTLFDEVTIDFNETPDGLNAGLDDIAVCDAMSYTLTGTGHTYQVGSEHNLSTRTWSYVSGPDATPTFADATDPHSLVTVDLYGSYVFRWTEINGNCTLFDEVTIDFNETPDGLNAGLDAIAVCDAMSYTLTGTGHPYQAGSEHNLSTRTWSYVSGPDATPTFADATDPHSLVTVDLYGSYVFRWTEINGNCTLFDEVTIDFNETPDGLNAGLDAIAVCDAMSYTLTGTGHTYQVGSEHNLSTRTWSYVSGPDATPTFADATDPHSLVTVDLYGSYVFRWTEINGNCTLFDEVTIDFNETPDGLNAGLDAIAVCDAMSYTLTGTGHTYQVGSEHNLSTRTWSYVSGPDATPTFADATDPHSLVTVDLYGSYVFRWTEINGNCTLFDEVTIDFNETPAAISAGADQALCGVLTTTLTGTGHTYQAGSDHAGSTRLWTQVSGIGTITFTDAIITDNRYLSRSIWQLCT